ncbi:MAG: hypothetical protein SNJ70_07500 [Armatimonadota bacterium]
MADSKRLNLDLDMDTSELLKSVREASNAVSKAATCNPQKDNKCKKQKTTLYAVATVCALVIILLIAVFAIPSSNERTAQNVVVNPPSTSTLEVKQTNKIPVTQSTPATGYTSGIGSSQGVRQPADDYEQPYEDPGM